MVGYSYLEDRHPSRKLNADYLYCFGCGITGFVAWLFALSSYESAKKP